MLAFFFAYIYGILIFALALEASTTWLSWSGFAAASWMIIAGSIAGYQRFAE
jgi:hypothetical protein